MRAMIVSRSTVSACVMMVAWCVACCGLAATASAQTATEPVATDTKSDPVVAVVNGKTLSEGESATISVKPGTLKIKCLKIETDSVLITVEGEEAPRLLRFR